MNKGQERLKYMKSIISRKLREVDLINNGTPIINMGTNG